MKATNATWDAAIELVLEHEGGFVDDPVDPGGATNFGISIRFLRAEVAAGRVSLDLYDVDGSGDLTAADMRGLTREKAVELYRAAFWDRYRLGDLPAVVAPKVFDMAVNMGPRQAFKLLQRAARAAGEDLVDDGMIGPKSRAAIAGIIDRGAHIALMAALRSEQAGFYRVLIAKRPALEKYKNGWLRRAYS